MQNIRFSSKPYKIQIVTQDLYKNWVKEYPEFKGIPIEKFRKYAHSLLNEYVSEVLINPHGVRLPHYMGDISLRYVDKLVDNTNYPKTAKLGVEVNHLNFITNGRTAKIIWSVDHARKFNKYLPLMGFKGKFLKEANAQLVENPEIFRDTHRTKSNRTALIRDLKQQHDIT